MYSVYDFQRSLAATGQANFQWLEANEISGVCDHVLSPLEVDAEAHLSLEGGADGLGWFVPDIPAGSGGYRSFSVRPEVQQAITVIDAEALAMQDVWLADEIDGFSTPPGDDGQNAIKVTARTARGNIYAIATNSTDEKVVWQRELPGLPPRGTATETNLTLGLRTTPARSRLTRAGSRRRSGLTRRGCSSTRPRRRSPPRSPPSRKPPPRRRRRR